MPRRARARARLPAVWLVALAGWAAPAVAEVPSARLEADTTTAQLGDPVLLTVTLAYPPGQEPALPAWDEWLDGVWHRYRDGAESAQEGGTTTQSHRLEVRFFKLGPAIVPPLTGRFGPEGGQPVERTTPPLAVTVVSARQAGEDSLRDVKPPVRVPGGIPLWLALLGGLGLLAAAGYGVWRWRRRRQVAVPEEPPPPPVDHAAEFVRIAGMGLIESGEYKLFFSLLSDNLRRYLEQRLGVEAMERTTSEIVLALQGTGLDAQTVEQVRQYLAFADLVKFARRVPSIQVARRAPEIGIAVLRAVADSRRAQEEAAAAAAAQAAPVADTG
ncbi:MAG: hypothetical protein AB1505_15150 [Candidatus Latescibacterota bacterium]